MQDKKAAFIPEATYHVYNRANGAEKLFISEENYRFFLEKYEQYISPVTETFCYCLMPNHFHFLVRIKNKRELIKTNPNVTGFENLSRLIAKGRLLRGDERKGTNNTLNQVNKLLPDFI